MYTLICTDHYLKNHLVKVVPESLVVYTMTKILQNFILTIDIKQ